MSEHVLKKGECPVCDASEMATLRAELERARAEVAYFKGREAHFAKVLRVADGGQYRADWSGAVQRLVDERAAAEARAESAEKERDEWMEKVANHAYEVTVACHAGHSYKQELGWCPDCGAAAEARLSRALEVLRDVDEHWDGYDDSEWGPEDEMGVAVLGRVAAVLKEGT